MTDKTEEQVAKERAQVAAMKNAQSVMTAVLERTATLESALKQARSALTQTKDWTPPSAYTFTSNGHNQKTVRDTIDGFIANIDRVLG